MLLKTGTRFSAETKNPNYPIYHYRLLGFDLADANNGTGCHYIVLFNQELQGETCVDAGWFRERQITIE